MIYYTNSMYIYNGVTGTQKSGLGSSRISSVLSKRGSGTQKSKAGGLAEVKLGGLLNQARGPIPGALESGLGLGF